MASPLEQFTIKPLIPIEVEGYNISFTNSSLLELIHLSEAIPTARLSQLEILGIFISFSIA